jgi:hypothetical protein
MAGLRWIGGAGQFVPGIPARDLTEEEVERYPQARQSSLYEDDEAQQPSRSKREKPATRPEED